MLRTSLLFLLCSLAACAVDAGGPIERGDLAAGGKADATLAERFCREHDEPAHCDPCDVGGFYSDGTCDLFCQRDDADCSVDGDACGAMSEQFLACTENVGEPETCVQEDNEYDLRACCRADWAYSYCAVVAPVTRDDANMTFASFYHNAEITNAPAGESGIHRQFSYVSSNFDASAFISEVMRIDADVRGCGDRTYSRSASDAIEMYQGYLAENDPFAAGEAPADSFTGTFEDEDNLAVFASLPASGDSDCDYADFYILGSRNQGHHFYFDGRRSPGDQLEGPAGVIYTPAQLAAVAQQQSFYEGNGGGTAILHMHGERDMEQLRRVAVTSYLQLNDHCFAHRASTSSDDALEIYDASVAELADWIYEEEGANWSEDSAALREVATDSDTLGMISIAFDESNNDNSEACSVWMFYILKADGNVLRVEYNFTD